MEKQLKDYLNLYLGGQVLFENGKRKTILPSDINQLTNVKIILRKIGSLTTEEATELNLLKEVSFFKLFGNFTTMTLTGDQVFNCLKKQIDLFGLIGTNLAVDLNTL